MFALLNILILLVDLCARAKIHTAIYKILEIGDIMHYLYHEKL